MLIFVDEPSNWNSYLQKLSTLVGVTRLARLQVEVVTDGIGDADIPLRIAANKTLYDPYTNKPMAWDPDKRQLYIDAYDEKLERIQVGI
jgi:hypothetical protein